MTLSIEYRCLLEDGQEKTQVVGDLFRSAFMRVSVVRVQLVDYLSPLFARHWLRQLSADNTEKFAVAGGALNNQSCMCSSLFQGQRANRAGAAASGKVKVLGRGAG